MDYTQERVATLHDYGDADPDVALDRVTVVVPMTEREYAGLAAEGVLAELERLDPGRVVVPLRAPPEDVGAFADWLDTFSLPLDVLWCSGPRVEELLDAHGLDGEQGKGRDVWLGLGQADRDFVVLHDADTESYEARDVRKLAYPLTEGFDFAKGYYARVEHQRLYGRLCRLLYEPLLAALADRHDHDVVDYLGAFRYALAGECAMTTDLAHSVRVQRQWGLEVGTLGEVFAHAGPDAAAQVDLGFYEHDHRAVSGPAGLEDMSRGVAAAALRAVTEAGVELDYDALRDAYREAAGRFVRGYAADAGFNGFDYDRSAEEKQVERYAGAVAPPGPDTRLPAWRHTGLDPATVREAARADLAAAREGER
ncbi:MAG: glycosyl transferase family 2 [Halobacteriaceae archaeon]